MTKKILFVTPYFGRSGSEMQLLYLLKNLDVKKYQIFLYTRDNGELLSLLPPHIKRFVGYKKHNNFLLRIFRLLLYCIGINPTEYQLKRLNKRIKPDLWYINTVVNRDAYNIAQKLGVRFIAHIHEMTFSYSFIKKRTLETIIDRAEICVGCSEMVCEKLRDMGHEKVRLLNGFVDKSLINIDQNKTLDLKKNLGISDEDFVWIISGAGSLVKGIDLVIPLIKKLKKNHKIIWVGGINNNGTAYYAQRAVKKNFKDRIFFVGNQSDDYYNYFNIGKGFLSLSREDSYPLVMIEAAHLGMPMVGFRSGGINEFVSSPKLGYLSYINDFEDLAKNMHRIEEEYVSIDRAYIQSYANLFNAKTQTKLLESILDEMS